MWKMKFRGRRISALRMVLIYLLFGGVWIFFSDRILLQLAPDVQNYLLLQTYKGWLFVFCTALLLYFLSVREFHVRDKVTEDLASSVLEKDELMRELHHRVKNNLQLILSLINLQRNNKEIDLLSRDILQQLYMRVHSIAVFHEKVYRLELYRNIPLADYIREIVNSAYYEYSEALDRIRIELDLSDREVTVERALPLGIILNELLLNCIIHAFPEEPPDDAVIKVKLTDEGTNTLLIVEDNGQGYAANVQHEGLGYTLIHSLLKQIDGEL
ncbi:MAG TPA: sensor histidine kinase, partial [Clostridia bacterium]|nr:sensor histidine kinase [Clostridia bacterium]